MQSLIERLKQQATANIADGQPLDTYGVIGNDFFGAMLTNGEALQIAEILEVASYPPVVKKTIAFLEVMPDVLEGPHGPYEWVYIGTQGYALKSEYRPVFVSKKNNWEPGRGEDGEPGHWGWVNFFRKTQVQNIETMLFQRTPEGWKWVFSEHHKLALWKEIF